jgi:hypothetical protein
MWTNFEYGAKRSISDNSGATLQIPHDMDMIENPFFYYISDSIAPEGIDPLPNRICVSTYFQATPIFFCPRTNLDGGGMVPS